MSHLSKQYPQLSVEIVEFVDDCQPGVVRAEFVDANGKQHSLIDKIYLFTSEFLDASSAYPVPGSARCEILERWRGSDANELVRISIDRPDHIDSTEGLSEFVVGSTQLID
ncbi:MAG: hypothetical protein V4555_10880 [Acidobacteriota bacterium]